jgi:fatty acid desaturase
MAWWKRSHNTHHVTPNSIEYDPDIQHLPVFVLTPDSFHGVMSYYHGRVMHYAGVAANVFIPVQHYIYFIAMALARYNMYLQSLILVVKGKNVAHQLVELFAMGLYFTWFGFLLSGLPSWGWVFLYLTITHTIIGVIHIQITLNHFTMPVFHGRALTVFDGNWVRSQCAATMDFDCPTPFDWFHGGLQFQLEHHLFPCLPRRRLRDAIPLVTELLEKHGLKRVHFGFVEANIIVLKRLRDTAAAAKKWDPALASMWNMDG